MFHIFIMFKRIIKMSKNLFDFGNEDDTIDNLQKNQVNETFSNENTKEINDYYNKYKNFSQNELLNEFLTTSRQKLKDGTLTIQGLQNMLQSLSPYLNEEQLNFLRGIIKRVDE